jgi:hypothetical protein
LARDAGLGAATRDEEEPVLRRFLSEASAQFARLGIALSPMMCDWR